MTRKAKLLSVLVVIAVFAFTACNQSSEEEKNNN